MSTCGASYEGSWKQGLKNGEGKLKTKNGDYYIGKFRADRIEGYGTMYYSDGKVYEGEWKNGKRNGDGVLTLPTGDRFWGILKMGISTVTENATCKIIN